MKGGSHLPQDATNVAKRGLNEAIRIGENLTNNAAENVIN